jgi:hypothetical protein
MADVYGVFSRCFVDCGNQPFTVVDKDGEQLKEVFVNHISPVRINNVFFLIQKENYFLFNIGRYSYSSR